MSFKLKNLFKGALAPLDLRAKESFLPNVHGDKQVWVRDERTDTIQPTQIQVRFGEQFCHLRIKCDLWVGGQGCWDKGAISTLLFYVNA
jgi:hypothetical protein